MVKKAMRQSRINLLTGILNIFLVLMLLANAYYISITYEKVEEAFHIEIESRQLAIDLANASDYLTNQMEAYVQFGNKVHLDNYWREVNETKTRERVIERLQELDVTVEELNLLEEARKNSDALIRTEEAAMKAVEDGDFDLARNLMFGTDYEKSKQTIVEPIEQFQQLLHDRVEKNVLNLQNELKRSIFIIMVIAIITAILMGINLQIANRKIIKPIVKLRDSMLTMADGDLTQSIDVEEDTSEIGQLAGAISKTKNNMYEILQNIINTADELGNGSTNLASAMEETSASMEGISTAIDDMAKGAAAQADNAQAGSEKLDVLAERINVSVNSANTINSHINTVAEVSNLGTQSIGELHNTVQNNTEIIGKVDEQVGALNEKSNSIGKITETIKAIAEQTNLLALNAAIEAARAGDAGRGFAVVSEEIRKLAEQVAVNAKVIEETILDIQSEIKSAKAQVDSSKIAMEQTSKVSNSTGEAFNNINEAVKGIVGQIGNLITNINQMNEDKNTVILSMQEISAVTQQSAASTEEVSASIEEQTATIEEVSQLTNKLQDMAQGLNGLTKRFNI